MTNETPVMPWPGSGSWTGKWTISLLRSGLPILPPGFSALFYVVKESKKPETTGQGGVHRRLNHLHPVELQGRHDGDSLFRPGYHRGVQHWCLEAATDTYYCRIKGRSHQ